MNARNPYQGLVVLAKGDRVDVEAISRTILDLLFADRPTAP